MRIGPGTRVFLSVSATPGRFGATVYNTLFERMGIDAVYLPRPAPGRAEQIVAGLDAFGFAGCSVSSPHKAAVVPHLGRIEPDAMAANAVNTVYREGGVWAGACTDIDGVVGAVGEQRPESAVVYGSGGVAGPAIVALRRMNVPGIAVVARREDAAREVRQRFGAGQDPGGRVGLVINATPAGRDGADSDELWGLIGRAEAYLDMPVVPSDTASVAHARSLGVRVMTGVDMCTHQIAAQARRYIGVDVPVEEVRGVVERDYFGGE